MYQDIDNAAFQGKIESNPDAIIIDVRTELEFNSGIIPNAININIFSPEAQSKLGALDLDKTYLVYCRSGQRSGQACQHMSQVGIKDVYNLNRGIMMWEGEVVSPVLN